MDALRGKTAIVIGASSGVGKATARSLLAEGVRVTAVARGAEGLDRLRAECGEGLSTMQGDGSESAFADRLLRESRPDLVILAAGGAPRMGPLTEQTWESFSEIWNSDTKAAFHVVQAALALPLRPGSVVVVNLPKEIRQWRVTLGPAISSKRHHVSPWRLMTESDAKNFEAHRSFIAGLAYRMLGSVAEAEDVVQDAFLRWAQSETSTVTHPRAYLARVEIGRAHV